jgi:hypothetical protein
MQHWRSYYILIIINIVIIIFHHGLGRLTRSGIWGVHDLFFL